MARTFKTGLGVYGDRVIADADFSTAGYVKQSGNVGAHPAPYEATVETFNQALVSGVTSVFQPNNSQARYTGGSTTQPVNNFMQAQALLARQRISMRIGLNRT